MGRDYSYNYGYSANVSMMALLRVLDYLLVHYSTLLIDLFVYRSLRLTRLIEHGESFLMTRCGNLDFISRFIFICFFNILNNIENSRFTK